MFASDELKTEHRAIERMLAIADKMANRLQAGNDIPPQMLQNVVDFVRTFADKCHHGKEEDLLFPALEKAGIPRQGGPIGVMLADHVQGRQYISDLAAATTRYAAGDKSARDAAATALRGYAELLRGHIYKEDNILFNMANQVLPPAEQTRLLAAFEDIEKTRLGPGVHEHFHAMLDEMEKTTAAW